MKKEIWKNILKIMGYCVAGFSSVFLIVNILAKFGFVSDEQLKSPFIFAIYVETSIIFGTVRAIIWMIPFIDKNKYIEKRGNSKGTENQNDSIIDIITQAYAQKRYSEVIYIGNAVSDFLWYCGRKELRLQIADFLLDAARRCNDTHTQARVLIEDSGNTLLEMPGKNNTKAAVKNIKAGIAIAKENNYTYLLIRGYRNYACALAYIYTKSSNKSVNDLNEAEILIDKGQELVASLPKGWEKIDAEASLYYAACRVYQNRGKSSEAIQSLIEAKKLYESGGIYPDKKTIITERLKKIYRELGRMYITDDDEKTKEEGCELLVKAIDICESDHDFNNLFRTALVLLENTNPGENSKYYIPVKSRCKTILAQITEKNDYTKRISAILSDEKEK